MNYFQKHIFYGKIENSGMMEKWDDKKYFNFSHFSLVGSGKVEGWKK